MDDISFNAEGNEVTMIKRRNCAEAPVLATASVATARPFGMFGHHGPKSPERMERMATFIVDEMLDELDARGAENMLTILDEASEDKLAGLVQGHAVEQLAIDGAGLTDRDGELLNAHMGEIHADELEHIADVLGRLDAGAIDKDAARAELESL